MLGNKKPRMVRGLLMLGNKKPRRARCSENEGWQTSKRAAPLEPATCGGKSNSTLKGFKATPPCRSSSRATGTKKKQNREKCRRSGANNRATTPHLPYKSIRKRWCGSAVEVQHENCTGTKTNKLHHTPCALTWWPFVGTKSQPSQGTGGWAQVKTEGVDAQ